MPTWSILGFEVYIPDLTEIINAVTYPITQFVSSSVSSLQMGIGSGLAGLSASVGGITQSVVSGVTALVSGSLDFITLSVSNISAGVASLGPSISGWFQSTWTQLTTFSNSVVSGLSASLGSLSATVGSTLAGWGATLNGAVEGARLAITNAFEGALSGLGAAVGGLFAGFGTVDVGSLLGSASMAWGTLYGAIATLGLRHSPITPEDAYAWVGPFLIQVTGAVSTLHGANLLAENFSLGQVDITLQEAWKYPATAAAVDLATELEAMPIREGLLPAFKRYILKGYVPYLPAYADMIRIYVKEGYMAEKWAELPPEFAGYMEELGYSSYWTQRLWGAHWVLPAVDHLYEMYHRTLGTRPEIGVTLDVLRTMLKYHDYEPAWRDNLEAITWRTWRIFDLRRGWEMNILSDEALIKRTIDSGFSPDEAPDLVATQKMYIMRSVILSLLAEADSDFIDGWITEEQLRANYDASPFRSEFKEMKISRAKLRRDRDLKKDWATVLKTYAQKRYITPEEYGAELSKLGMVEESVSAAVEDLKAKLKTAEKAETAEKRKDLTDARILTIWKVLKKSDDWALTRLKGLGYSDEDAKDILDSERRD